MNSYCKILLLISYSERGIDGVLPLHEMLSAFEGEEIDNRTLCTRTLRGTHQHASQVAIFLSSVFKRMNFEFTFKMEGIQQGPVNRAPVNEATSLTTHLFDRLSNH
jgi:hypothetical protein